MIRITNKKSQYSKNIIDPFIAEEHRDKLAQSRQYQLFKNTYKNFPEIKNVNTNSFWNNNFSRELSLNDQDEFTKEKIRHIASLLPKDRLKILDLGFGQCYFEESLQMKDLQYAISGIDISTIAVQRAGKKFEGRFIKGDILSLEKYFQNEQFDVIIAIEVIEHILPSDILFFLKKVNRKLVKGGYFIISTPLNEGLRYKRVNPSGHVRAYTENIVTTELMLTGFNILDIKTFYAFPNFYHLKKLLVKFFPHRWEPNNIVIKAVKK